MMTIIIYSNILYATDGIKWAAGTKGFEKRKREIIIFRCGTCACARIFVRVCGYESARVRVSVRVWATTVVEAAALGGGRNVDVTRRPKRECLYGAVPCAPASSPCLFRRRRRCFFFYTILYRCPPLYGPKVVSKDSYLSSANPLSQEDWIFTDDRGNNRENVRKPWRIILYIYYTHIYNIFYIHIILHIYYIYIICIYVYTIVGKSIFDYLVRTRANETGNSFYRGNLNLTRAAHIPVADDGSTHVMIVLL